MQGKQENAKNIMKHWKASINFDVLLKKDVLFLMIEKQSLCTNVYVYTKIHLLERKKRVSKKSMSQMSRAI